MIDARDSELYYGNKLDEVELNLWKGCISGASNVSIKDLINKEDMTFKSTKEMAKVFTERNIDIT